MGGVFRSCFQDVVGEENAEVEVEIEDEEHEPNEGKNRTERRRVLLEGERIYLRGWGRFEGSYVQILGGGERSWKI